MQMRAWPTTDMACSCSVNSGKPGKVSFMLLRGSDTRELQQKWKFTLHSAKRAARQDPTAGADTNGAAYAAYAQPQLWATDW
eukprot:1152020-Pelagomonas_calceolata.AAC.5